MTLLKPLNVIKCNPTLSDEKKMRRKTKWNWEKDVMTQKKRRKTSRLTDKIMALNGCFCKHGEDCENSVNTRTEEKCASYHVRALFEPGECERRVSSPFAVEGDIRVNIYRLWLRLHQQNWADWRQRNREGCSLSGLSNNAVGLKGEKLLRGKRKHNNGVFYLSDSRL